MFKLYNYDKINNMRKLAKSTSHGLRGIYLIIKGQRNMRIHISAVIISVLLGLWLDISYLEWLTLILLFGLVLTAESLNTSIEHTLDCVSKEHRGDIRDAKDVAAGAVLVSVIISIIIGIIIFLPKLLSL